MVFSGPLRDVPTLQYNLQLDMEDKAERTSGGGTCLHDPRMTPRESSMLAEMPDLCESRFVMEYIVGIKQGFCKGKQ